MTEKTARRVFVAAVAFLLAGVAFAYGWSVEFYRAWPYQLIHSARDTVKSYLEYGTLVPPGRLVAVPAGAARERFKIHDATRMQDGYYFFLGWDSDHQRYAAWLYDSAGELRHSWNLEYDALDSRGPTRGDGNPHGFWPLPDWSVIVNYDNGDMLARLDACSRPIWKNPGVYHHLMSRGDDGSLWMWRGDGTPYAHFQYIANVNAETGETIREIGLVEDIIRPLGELSLIFGFRPDFEFVRPDLESARKYEHDIFHTNDVEVLTSALAPMFPMFEAGDLLLSVRDVHLLVVIDPDDLRVKWWGAGPWWMQHDPDFAPDGTISVYDNNTGRGRSEILKIDPTTGQVRNELFGGAVRFSSDYMGAHQYLPNGNVLIVVPGEGRILEVTAEGDYVMEFNNLSRVGPQYNEHVENGMWVPADFFREAPGC
jgi:hypothetical protein